MINCTTLTVRGINAIPSYLPLGLGIYAVQS